YPSKLRFRPFQEDPRNSMPSARSVVLTTALEASLAHRGAAGAAWVAAWPPVARISAAALRVLWPLRSTRPPAQFGSGRPDRVVMLVNHLRCPQWPHAHPRPES